MQSDSYQEADPEYQSLSTGAVVSLLLALLSPAVLFGTLLAVIPLLSILFALVALNRMAASEGALTGRRPALLGLAIATACLSGWLAYAAAHRDRMHTLAAPVAEAMLSQLQQKDAQGAYLLSLWGPERKEMLSYLNSPEFKGEVSADPLSPETPETKLQNFRHKPVVAAVIEGPKVLSFAMTSRGSVGQIAGGREYVIQTHVLNREGAEPLPVVLTIEHLRQQGQDYWRVSNLAFPAPDAA